MKAKGDYACGAVLAAMLCADTAASAELAVELSGCAAIAEDRQRLHCYDAVSGRLQEAAEKPAVKPAPKPELASASASASASAPASAPAQKPLLARKQVPLQDPARKAQRLPTTEREGSRQPQAGSVPLVSPSSAHRHGSWIDEIEARLRDRAGNAPTVRAGAVGAASAAVVDRGEALSDDRIEELIARFSK